jgi:hypothetical protein
MSSILRFDLGAVPAEIGRSGQRSGIDDNRRRPA